MAWICRLAQQHLQPARPPGVNDIDRAIRVRDRPRRSSAAARHLRRLAFLEGATPTALREDAELHQSFPRLRGTGRIRWPERVPRVHRVLVSTVDRRVHAVWCIVRPHFSFGTVEVRICDVQATAQESDALAGLIVACIAQATRDIDEGVPFADPPPRLVEENMWRTIRFGMDGAMIDLGRARRNRAAAIDGLLAWTAPIRSESAIEVVFPERNGAQRQRDRLVREPRARRSSLHR